LSLPPPPSLRLQYLLALDEDNAERNLAMILTLLGLCARSDDERLLHMADFMAPTLIDTIGN
jgi:hypothetical protein